MFQEVLHELDMGGVLDVGGVYGRAWGLVGDEGIGMWHLPLVVGFLQAGLRR